MKSFKYYIFFVFLIILTFVSCNSTVSSRKILNPAKDQFKERLKYYIMYDSFPDMKKEIVEDDKLYFDNSCKIKKRVIDSLKYLTKQDFLIIDTEKDYNGRRVDRSYFFFNNKIITAGYKEIVYKKNGEPYIKFVPYVNEETVENLKKYHDYAIIANNYFKLDSLERISEPIFGDFVYFNATIVKNKKVRYYNISTDSTGYKITKIL